MHDPRLSISLLPGKTTVEFPLTRICARALAWLEVIHSFVCPICHSQSEVKVDPREGQTSSLHYYATPVQHASRRKLLMSILAALLTMIALRWLSEYIDKSRFNPGIQVGDPS
jgi:hypothetical protein